MSKVSVLYKLEFDEETVNWGEDFAMMIVVTEHDSSSFDSPEFKLEVAKKCLPLFELDSCDINLTKEKLQYHEYTQNEVLEIHNSNVLKVIETMQVTFIGIIQLPDSSTGEDVTVLLKANRGS